MLSRRFLNIVISMLMIVSLIPGGTIQASAQVQDPQPNGNGQDEEKKDKITQKDRQDAAARALQESALNPLLVEMQAMVLATAIPT